MESGQDEEVGVQPTRAGARDAQQRIQPARGEAIEGRLEDVEESAWV